MVETIIGKAKDHSAAMEQVEEEPKTQPSQPERFNVGSILEIETIKICPECKKEVGKENIYCPYDGSLLDFKELENVCVMCKKQYGNTYEFCPVHGEKLRNLKPSSMDILNDKSFDLFRRSVCPECDAYNNWEIRNDEYTCKSCNRKYKYSGEKAFILNAGIISHEIKEESVESQHYYKILTSIDKSNQDYWLNIFSKFEEKSGFNKWNWPSFFFDVYRYFWKGLWQKGLLFTGIVFVGVLLLGDLGKEAVALIPLLFLGVKIYLGRSGSKDYYNFIKGLDGNVEKGKKDLRIGRVLFFVLLAITFIRFL